MSLPFACDMMAIPAEQRHVHHALIRRLLTDAVLDISELPNGFAFRFPSHEYPDVTEFVGRERRCCPFLEFALEVPANGRPILLRLTGSEGVKEFIRAELHLPPTHR